MMLFHRQKLEITPICQQTSFLEKKSSLEHNVTKYEVGWIEFTSRYVPSGIRYDILKQDFTVYTQMRTVVEQDFKDTFGIEIPIYNKRYIIERFKALKQFH